MKRFTQKSCLVIWWMAVAASGMICVLPGCIDHSRTIYHNPERVKVDFQTEKAGRIFYEALSKMPYHDATESHTEVFVPVIFDNETTVKTGDNAKFNEAVRRCDINRDGLITETEAEIFASQFH